MQFEHRLAQLNAGIVDEDVDCDALGVETLEDAADLSVVGDVESARRDAMARRRKRLLRGRELPLVPAVKNDRRARFRETPRHPEAEAVGRAGDEGGLAR